MKKVLLFSLLLVGGLILSQFIDRSPSAPTALVVLDGALRLLTMIALAFIMIHVGYEFEIDKKRPKQYVWDYVVAGTAAAFPWIFVTLYFVFVLAPPGLWSHLDLWRENLLAGRFAAPTSAGVLFSMLAAAGLAATWVFRKARILAIFDDLDTILLMIPLKIMMVGMRWQLAIIIAVIIVLLWMAWKYLHLLRWPITWPWVLTYSAGIAIASELIYRASKLVDAQVPIHLEVLLPAFVLGCMLARPVGHDPPRDDAREGHQEGPESASEQRVSTIISACFMVLVGLSMPSIAPQPPKFAAADVAIMPAAIDAPSVEGSVLTWDGADPALVAQKNAMPGWGMIALHVLAVTVLSNLGKMFPLFCYRREVDWRQRLAVAVGMFPRGEVGAGVLVVSISYGLGGPALTVAVLSLALNLLLTGVFILIVKKLIAASAAASQARPSPAPAVSYSA